MRFPNVHYIQFINFMGDMDDYHETNLIGPYPTRDALAGELARLDGLPLGKPEFVGGYLFAIYPGDPATSARTVEPGTTAAATTIKEFFDAFFGHHDDDPDDRKYKELFEWLRFVHPYSYVADHVIAEERRNNNPGCGVRRRNAQLAAAARRSDDHGQPVTSYVHGDTVPGDVEFLGDARGNLWVRWEPGADRWWQPAPDPYTCYPDNQVWIPPIRATVLLLHSLGPLTVVPDDLATERNRARLVGLRPAG